MHLTDEQQFQINTYGQLLTGDETELDLARLARIHFLKKKMRPALAAAIGDTPDNIADSMRALILGDCIALGIVTDQAVIDAHKAYLAALLEGYGGPEAIAAVLQGAAQAIGQYVVNKYFTAKSQIMASDDEDEIRSIDID